jgi:hypothetical protein
MTASRPDPGALSIAPPDGYQYGDDHPWTSADKARLSRHLDRLAADLAADLAGENGLPGTEVAEPVTGLTRIANPPANKTPNRTRKTNPGTGGKN